MKMVNGSMVESGDDVEEMIIGTFTAGMLCSFVAGFIIGGIRRLDR